MRWNNSRSWYSWSVVNESRLELPESATILNKNDEGVRFSLWIGAIDAKKAVQVVQLNNQR